MEFDKFADVWYNIYREGDKMNYISVAQAAKKWNVSERSVRNYCNIGKIEGVMMEGKTWYIPEDASKPERINKHIEKKTLLDILL